MDQLLVDLKDRMVTLVLSFSVFVFALFPLTALADGELALDVGHRSGGGEGDPLDTNDADGGDISGGSDRDTMDTMDASVDSFNRGIWSTRLLVVPERHGSVLIFRIIRLSDSAHLAGARNAK